MARPRYVIVVTAEDGATQCFGTWLDGAKARRVHDQLVEASGFYGNEDDDAGEYEVSLELIEPWPGIRAWRRGA